MDRVEALVAAVDWSGVEGGRPGNHAGPMTGAPEAVADLWHAEAGRRWRAVDVLEMGGFEFATVRPATVPLVPVIAAAVGDPRSAGVTVYHWSDPELPLRARLLGMLGAAAASPAWGGTDEELRAKAAAVAAGVEGLSLPDLMAGEEAAERLGVRAMAEQVVGEVLPFVDDLDVRVAHAAVFAVTRFVQLTQAEVRGAAATGGAAERAAVRRLLAVAARGDSAASVAGAAAYALAVLGADTTALLGQAALVVRACAALSPSTVGDARAVAALEEALRYTPDNDTWLYPGSSLQRLRLHMEFAEVAAARAGGFDELVPGALAVAVPEAETTETGWGPLLRVAFPRGWQDRPLTANQREFLRRLVDNDGIWGDRAQYTLPHLAGAGLPPRRDSCRALLAAF